MSLANPILIDLPMPITTERLILRPPASGDGAELNAAILETFEDLNKWMPWAKTKPSLAESEINIRQAIAKWVLREDLRVHIFDKATGKLAGSSGLHRINWDIPSFEIGYWARKSFWGRGYITESTAALVRYAFEQLKAKRVEIRCDSRNERSLAIMKRLGFEHEGCLRQNACHGPGMTAGDTLIYSRLSCEGLPS